MIDCGSQGDTPKDKAEKAPDPELAAYLGNRQHYQMIQREDQETTVWEGWMAPPAKRKYDDDAVRFLSVIGLIFLSSAQSAGLLGHSPGLRATTCQILSEPGFKNGTMRSPTEIKWFLFEWFAGTQRRDGSGFNAPARERFQRFLKIPFPPGTPGAMHTAKTNLDQK